MKNYYKMKKINLKKIIENQNLDIKEVAVQLFPTNKYPKFALDRVIRGESFLDTKQLSRLSLMTGLPIEFLYDDGWAMSSSGNIIKLISGDYTAELNLKNNTTKIFHKKSLFHEEIIHKTTILLSEYINQLNELITKHSKS